MIEAVQTLDRHFRILWALMLRELATRYGRDNIGFLWVIFEPLSFGVGVFFLYRAIRGPYSEGVATIPFILTGYMPAILTRHMVLYSLNAAKINSSLLYHSAITVLDLFLARIVLEFIGVSFAFFICICLLVAFGLAKPPVNAWLMYQGWFITGFVSCGMALLVGAISEIFDVVERIIGLTLYLLIPLSGTFFLADWLPEDIRRLALMLPFLNCAEMIRGGYFGSAVTVHFNEPYTIACAAVMAVLGLLLLQQVRDKVEVA